MNIIKSKSETQHIVAISDLLNKLIPRVIEKKGAVTLALSGGKSPIPLFKHLSMLSLPWDKVTIVLVDERIINIENLDSNENLVRTYLLQNMASSAKFIGLMDQDLDNILRLANTNIPTIDIALLGMGNDGHTASIFPDCKELELALNPQNKDTYMLANPVSAKYQRVTLTLNALKKIKCLIVSINGEEKLKIIEEAGKKENKNYPISYLIGQRTDINVYWHK